MFTFTDPIVSTSLLTFLLIFLAEMGDKSQMVCMALAAKHKAKPVFFGAVVAFLILNLFAVLFGASLQALLPMTAITAVAALLFFVFAGQAFLSNDEDDDEETQISTSRSIFISAFMLIFVAELGDKTQIAIATLSTTQSALITWLSASLALIFTTGIGVFAGRKWLNKIEPRTLNKISGVFFLIFAVLASMKFISLL